MNLKELEALRIFFKDNELLLVNGDSIGEVKLPETNWSFVEDCLVDGDIKGVELEKDEP